MVGQSCLGLPASLHRRLGAPADEGHEHRDERHGDDDDDEASDVLQTDGDGEHHRHDRGEHQLGKVLGVVAVQGIQAGRHQGDERARGGACVGGTGQPSGQDVPAQLRLHCCAGAMGQRLLGPGQQCPSGEHGGEQSGPPCQTGRRVGVEDRGDRLRQQPSLGEDEQRGAHPDHAQGDEERQGRSGATHEPGIKRGSHVHLPSYMS